MSSGARLVRMLLDATRSGKIRWVRNHANHDLYEGSIGGEKLLIRFVRFVRVDKASSDRHLVEVEAFGVTTDHAVGTDGMEMVLQMVSVGDTNLRNVRNAIRQRINEAEDAMAELLESEPASSPLKRVPIPAGRSRNIRVRSRR